MKDVVVIGAGKFALEVARYIGDVTVDGRPEYGVARYLVVDGETAHAPAEKCMALEEFEPGADTRVVLALSDTASRRVVIDGFMAKHGLAAENIVHPTAMVDPAALEGVGNIIGSNCYVGVNATLGDYNVVNYHCTIGHHSRLGSNNFIAPNFNCGNSVEIGDDNFFGLSCTLAPEVLVGSGCTFQAGISVFDNASSGHSYLVPNRVKSIKTSSRSEENYW